MALEAEIRDLHVKAEADVATLQRQSKFLAFPFLQTQIATKMNEESPGSVVPPAWRLLTHGVDCPCVESTDSDNPVCDDEVTWAMMQCLGDKSHALQANTDTLNQSSRDRQKTCQNCEKA